MRANAVIYGVSDAAFPAQIEKTRHTLIFLFPNQEPDESTPYFLVLPKGSYTFECWGGSGTFNGGISGKGAYVSGKLALNKTQMFYLFLGGSGFPTKNSLYNFNGGGRGQKYGGGATDVRLINGEWDDEKSLVSRIMVAAGAGGQDCYGRGGDGGTLNGSDSITGQDLINNGNAPSVGKGATQTEGGKGYSVGSFGKGGAYDLSLTGDIGGGGGGGYYGGSTGLNKEACGGGGGSSFISGHPNCDSVIFNDTGIVHTGRPNHISDLIFTDTVMKSGKEQMPQPKGDEKEGHEGNGVIKITSEYPIITYFESCKRKSYIQLCLPLLITSLCFSL